MRDNSQTFLMTAGQTLARLWNAFGHSRCLVCGRSQAAVHLQHGCCSECSRELQPRSSGFCPGCGVMFSLEEPVSLCIECRSAARPWDGFGFFGPYQGLLRDLILDFKFQGGLGYASILQDLILQAYSLHLHPFVPECIIPVPLHPSRLQARGYNQSLELGRRLARRLKVRIRPKALVRLTNTPSQTGLSRKERLANLKGTIVADQALLSGKKILLIDDIYTTGATMTACARALHQARARQIKVLVLARASL